MGGIKKVKNWVAKKQVSKLSQYIKKDDFLLQLKTVWYPYVSRDANIDDEVVKARERINQAGILRLTFDIVRVTDEDLRKILQEIIDEKASK